MKDKFGNPRGKCKNCVDECEEYQYNAQRGNACDYCGCKPTQHEHLKDDEPQAAAAPAAAVALAPAVASSSQKKGSKILPPGGFNMEALIKKYKDDVKPTGLSVPPEQLLQQLAISTDSARSTNASSPSPRVDTGSGAPTLNNTTSSQPAAPAPVPATPSPPTKSESSESDGTAPKSAPESAAPVRPAAPVKPAAPPPELAKKPSAEPVVTADFKAAVYKELGRLKGFIDQLDNLLNMFMVPLVDAGDIVYTPEVRPVFLHIDSLRDCASTVHAGCNPANSTECALALSSSFESFEPVYAAFVANLPTAMNILNGLMLNYDFAVFVGKASQKVGGTQLSDLLQFPVEYLSSLPSVFKEWSTSAPSSIHARMKSHADTWQVLIQDKRVALKHDSSHAAYLSTLLQCFLDPNEPPLTLKDTLLCQGGLFIVDPRGKPTKYRFLLFADRLVIASYRNGKYNKKEALPLRILHAAEIKPAERAKPGLELSFTLIRNQREKITLSAPSAEGKVHWLKMLSSAISTYKAKSAS